jgi:hypothetical protein
VIGKICSSIYVLRTGIVTDVNIVMYFVFLTNLLIIRLQDAWDLYVNRNNSSIPSETRPYSDAPNMEYLMDPIYQSDSNWSIG